MNRRIATTFLLTAWIFLPSSKAWCQLDLSEIRDQMVQKNVADEGVKNERVLASMRRTPRHEFVPVSQRKLAYYDMALPIGFGQTISPPFVVAYMTEQLDPKPTDKVLEIGTGSGYQSAVLSPLVKDVYSIEIVEQLGHRAAATLRKLGYKNVHTKIGDGYKGWPENAPFDKIIVTCSPEDIPKALVEQLREGGRLIIPLGERYQQTLYLYRKRDGKLVSEALLPTMFVPMTGKAEDNREVKPDPLHPQLYNGDFEKVNEKSGKADGWYYQRQVVFEKTGHVPVGKRFAHFTNLEPGRGAHVVQAFAIDGSSIHKLAVSCMVQANGVRPGQSANQLPGVMLSFYDATRRMVGQPYVGAWRGTFDWQRVNSTIKVPPTAKECIVHVGLMGATGEVNFDDVTIEPAK